MAEKTKTDSERLDYLEKVVKRMDKQAREIESLNHYVKHLLTGEE